jgi:hypothetical protein
MYKELENIVNKKIDCELLGLRCLYGLQKEEIKQYAQERYNEIKDAIEIEQRLKVGL